MSIFDMYRTKKKKVVDPTAPPRPNLLNHEKRLKDATLTVEQQADQIRQLNRRVGELESKLTHQTAYLSSVHQLVHKLSKNH
jgi:TolA-binding protein